MTTAQNFFATCPKNLEGLLEVELISLGAVATKQTVAGVEFSGDMTLAYRVCLWSRLANRILFLLTTFNAKNAAALYDGIREIKWQNHLRPDGSFVVDFSGVSPALNNSHFSALKVKDAIVDQIREATGMRPAIDKEHPDLRVNAYLYRELATVSIDLSGDSLHRRGYRTCPGEAPLKENLAAAVLYRSNWRKFASLGKPLFDPMCGSGTILIEAAMIAQDCAPGLLRKSFGFSRWLKHDRRIWESLLLEARERRELGRKKFSAIICGCDQNPKTIAIAKQHLRNADLEKVVTVEVGEMREATPAKYHFEQPGIVITNPPYGERLNDVKGLHVLYGDFGAMLRQNFLDWDAAMFTGNPDLGKTMGLCSTKQYNFFNGTISCKLLLFRVTPEMFWREYKGDKQLSTSRDALKTL